MYKYFLLAVFLAFLVTCAPQTEAPVDTGPSVEDFSGRWDVSVDGSKGSYPSWFEIGREGGQLTGQFVGRVGSARPIVNVEISDNRLTFSLPPQYEEQQTDLKFTGELTGDELHGTTNAEDGSLLHWTAVRAPELAAPQNPEWGDPIQLFNGKDLAGWKPRHADVPNNWKAQKGILANTEKGTDLITEQEFENFKLQVEFRYAKGGNSGIYLRGRYEVQVQDDYGKEPSSVYLGGVYGFVTPTKNAARKALEWQTYDITLLGRWITVVLNGETVIDSQEIPGITGGALDGNQGEAGPIMLQGDHGPVSYRNIVLTPVKQGD